MLVSSHPAISQETQSLWDPPAPFPVIAVLPSSFFVLGAGQGVCEGPAHQRLLKAAAGPAGSLSSPCSLASCCDCWCHRSPLTKYMWSLNVLLVLTQDISRSARPALTHMGPSKFTDAPSHHLWRLSLSPAPPLSPFPLITLLTLTPQSHACSQQPALAASLLQTASSSAAARQQTPLGQPIMHRTLDVCGHPLMSHTGGPCPVLPPSRTGPPAVPPVVKQREWYSSYSLVFSKVYKSTQITQFLKVFLIFLKDKYVFDK